MSTVRDTARLHPETVTNYKSHTKKKPRKKPAANLRGRYVKVDPRVWGTAMKLAKGDAKRLKVIHETEVIVNNPKN